MRPLAATAASMIAIALLSPAARLQEQTQKGGEEETGPYAVVENWPAPWSRPGYIWGSQPGIVADTPNRIFIAARGELKLPETLPRGFNGIWGSLNQRATEPKPEMRNCIVVVDGSGKLIEAWTQWDKLFEGGGGTAQDSHQPVMIRSATGRERRAHQIYEFTHDGKQLVRTLLHGKPTSPAATTGISAGRRTSPGCRTEACWSPTASSTRGSRSSTRTAPSLRHGARAQCARAVQRPARHRDRPQRTRLRRRPHEPPHSGLRWQRHVPRSVARVTTSQRHRDLGRPACVGR